MIEQANENIGRKVKVLNTNGHCLTKGSVGIITELDSCAGVPWFVVLGGTDKNTTVTQILLQEDFEYVE